MIRSLFAEVRAAVVEAARRLVPAWVPQGVITLHADAGPSRRAPSPPSVSEHREVPPSSTAGPASQNELDAPTCRECGSILFGEASAIVLRCLNCGPCHPDGRPVVSEADHRARQAEINREPHPLAVELARAELRQARVALSAAEREYERARQEGGMDGYLDAVRAMSGGRVAYRAAERALAEAEEREGSR